MKVYKESVLKSGLTVLTSEDANSDIVTLTVGFMAGSRHEVPDERGYAHLLEHMLLKGTREHPSIEAVGVLVDRIGGYMNASTGLESVHVRFIFAKEHLADMLALIAEITTQPLLDEKTLENEKKVVIQELKRHYDTRGPRVWEKNSTLIFGDHPLSRYVIGEEAVISGASPERLRAYYKKFFVPSRAAVVVAGNAKHKEVVALAEKHFVFPNTLAEAEEPMSAPVSEEVLRFMQDPGSQTQLFFNFVVPKPTLRETVALNWIVNMLGFGTTGFLKKEVRHKAGLVYAIGAYLNVFEDAAHFYISTASTQPEAVIPIVKNLLQTFDTFFTPALMPELKEQFRGALVRWQSDPSAELSDLYSYWAQNRRLVPPHEILEILDSLSYDEVMGVKNKYLTPERLLITAFGEKDFSV